MCAHTLIFAQDNAISNAINTSNIQSGRSDVTSAENPAKEIVPFWKGWSVGFAYGFTQFDGDIRQHNHYPAYQKDGNFFELKSAVSLSVHKQINSFYSLNARIWLVKMGCRISIESR